MNMLGTGSADYNFNVDISKVQTVDVIDKKTCYILVDNLYFFLICKVSPANNLSLANNSKCWLDVI